MRGATSSEPMADDSVAQASPIGMIGPQSATRVITRSSFARASTEAEVENFQINARYTTMPDSVAASVPRGIDTRGWARSPDSPTPWVIPVNAGNTIAKVRKNGSWPSTRASQSTRPFAASVGAPAKNIPSETTSTANTT